MSVAGPVPMSGVPLGSAAGLLSMLEEEQTQLQVAALTNLNKVIDTHWAEVASSISVIEAMYEDEFFAQRELAALLASKVRRAPDARDLPPDGAFPRGLAVCPQKQDLRSVPLDTSAQVFYHLGELNDALNYALCAGGMFDVTESNDFVKTLLGTRASPAPRSNLPVVLPLTAFSRASFGKKKVNNRSDPRAPPPIPFLPTAKAIDEYIEQRQKPTSEQAIDARLVSIVERMFQRCFDDGQIHQAIGVALETKRLDKLEEAIHTSTDVAEALNYATKVCQTLVTSREFRREVLTVLVRMYESDHVENNYLNVCQCLMFLDDADGVAAILTRLVEGEEED